MEAGGRGDLVAAERAFRDAIVLAPDEPYPHYELGYTLALAGKFSEALVELKRTSEIAPSFYLVDVEIYLCELVLARALDRDTLIAFRKLLARFERGDGTTLETEQLCRVVVASRPELALGHYLLAKCVIERLPEEATREFELCLTLAPDPTTASDARHHLGMVG